MQVKDKKAEMVLGERLRYFRRQKGYTQIELARLVGRNTNQVTLWERGTQVPKFFTICKFAKIFGVSVAMFDPQEPFSITI